jgi:outer membrane lipoprotein SlyB
MSHAMSLPRAPAPQSATQRWLWVGLGTLAATTLALGAALLQVYHRSADEVSPAVPLTPVSALAATVEALPLLTEAPTEVPTPNTNASASKTAKAPAQTAPAASKSAARRNHQKSSAVPATAAGPLLCAQCGRVEAVTPVQREAKASGVGAVAGAVVGGIVGNQFGGGDGKTLATIAGMVGGGWAGNTVEKKMKTVTVYRVDVRMENGSLRTLEQAQPVAVGSRVTVDGNSLRMGSSSGQAL